MRSLILLHVLPPLIAHGVGTLDLMPVLSAVNTGCLDEMLRRKRIGFLVVTSVSI